MIAVHRLRVVLDTNVLLSALVFTNGQLAQLRVLWQTQAFTVLTSKDAIQELIRVLNYPKFKLDDAKRDSLLADYLPYAQAVEVTDSALLTAPMPQCRDPKDQMFLSLAQSAKADFLVTGDEDLLSLGESSLKQATFRIITPAALLKAC